MKANQKIGRNDPCPCGSGKKYKACCLGTIDWQKPQFADVQTASRHLSLRGKNIGFLNAIAGALQFNRFTPSTTFAEVKRAFSPKVVQQIYLAVQDLWPDLDDFERCVRADSGTVVTNLRSRWKEIELDRELAGIDLQGWSPFAKALQESDLKILNDVPMQAALRLREEHRLESLRLFFRKVWTSCRDPEEFSEKNAVNLSAELHDEVAKANEEWRAIDQNLLKWLGTTWGAAVVSADSVGFVPAASGAAVTGITGLIQARMKRHAFKERFPAGFFLGLRNR